MFRNFKPYFTSYAELMSVYDALRQLALEAMRKGESDLVTFYVNASNGFKKRALELEMD